MVKSGIVFYPEYPIPAAPAGIEADIARAGQGFWNLPPAGVRRPAGPNIARQLGMVTNAKIDDEGNVLLGTVHAVPYDPAIAREITDMCYPERGSDHYRPPYTSKDRARRKELTEKLWTAAYEYLGVQGLAVDSLARTLAGRRMDIIAPTQVWDMGLALSGGMLIARPRMPGEPTDNVIGTVWARHPQERGVYVEYQTDHSKPKLGREHPLTKVHGRNYKAEGHTIMTTKATYSPMVHEDLTVVTKHSSPDLLRNAPGFSYQKEREELREKYKAVYRVPMSEEAALEIAEIEQRITEANEEAAKRRDELQGEEWGYQDHYHPNAAGDTIRDNELRLITEHLDPIDDPVWRERLN